MNKWQKLGLAVGMGTAVVTTSHIINKFIFESATINNYTGETVNTPIAGNLAILHIPHMAITTILHSS